MGKRIYIRESRRMKFKFKGRGRFKDNMERIKA